MGSVVHVMLVLLVGCGQNTENKQLQNQKVMTNDPHCMQSNNGHQEKR